jgi:hypothetical protein
VFEIVVADLVQMSLRRTGSRPAQPFENNGAGERIRTADLRITNGDGDDEASDGE